jgi:hypothetical protein
MRNFLFDMHCRLRFHIKNEEPVLRFFLDTVFGEPYTFRNCNIRVADSMQIETGRIDNHGHKESSKESTRQEGSKESHKEKVILRQEDSGNTLGGRDKRPPSVCAAFSGSNRRGFARQ